MREGTVFLACLYMHHASSPPKNLMTTTTEAITYHCLLHTTSNLLPLSLTFNLRHFSPFLVPYCLPYDHYPCPLSLTTVPYLLLQTLFTLLATIMITYSCPLPPATTPTTYHCPLHTTTPFHPSRILITTYHCSWPPTTDPQLLPLSLTSQHCSLPLITDPNHTPHDLTTTPRAITT